MIFKAMMLKRDTTKAFMIMINTNCEPNVLDGGYASLQPLPQHNNRKLLPHR